MGPLLQPGNDIHLFCSSLGNKRAGRASLLPTAITRSATHILFSRRKKQAELIIHQKVADFLLLDNEGR